MTAARLLFLVLLFSSLSNAFRLQGVAVRGRLLCGEKPLRGAQVKIYDIDTNPGDPDDLLDASETDREGNFAVTGTTRELTDIDPIIYLYHDCDDGIRPCQKKVTLKIPKKFIYVGEKPDKWFELGTLNLETNFPDQGRSCNH